METKRYSLSTVGKALGFSPMTVYSRAKNLGINTGAGLTAEDVKRIRDYQPKERYCTRCGVDELKAELEGLPDKHSDGEMMATIIFASNGKRTQPETICHQSDVIELLIGALRDALDKPMQKPLTLTEANSYQE